LQLPASTVDIAAVVSSISSIYSTAVYGLNTATNRFNTTAQKIANYGTGTPGSDDLAENAVDLISEKTAFKANALVLKSADQMLGSLLDILDTPRRS
jgi:flagellar basal body rod protein FlgC